LARTIYIRCIYGTFGREITKYTVIYGLFIRFWPTLFTSVAGSGDCSPQLQGLQLSTTSRSLCGTSSRGILVCTIIYRGCIRLWPALFYKQATHRFANSLIGKCWPEPYIYGVYTVFLAGESKIYGHIRCIYTVLANPTHDQMINSSYRSSQLGITSSLKDCNKHTQLHALSITPTAQHIHKNNSKHITSVAGSGDCCPQLQGLRLSLCAPFLQRRHTRFLHCRCVRQT
jgi:hypothetical protein